VSRLTEVVRTPHSSNFSKVGVGALGVSINSNSDSLPLALCGFDILAAAASTTVQLWTVEKTGRKVWGENGRRTVIWLGFVHRTFSTSPPMKGELG
jgi:hypothetical protein